MKHLIKCAVIIEFRVVSRISYTMELNLVLLLSIIMQTMTIVRVQGYYNTNSSTLSNARQSYQPIYNNELIEKSRQRHLRQFEQSFKHYSPSENRREPRFISFQTKDENIEVEIGNKKG